MFSADPSLIKVADKDLVKEATLSGMLFLVAWLIVVYTTEVADELPLVSMIGILLFVLLVTTRLVLGYGFDRLYERMAHPRWIQAFGATVLVNGATWGTLNAIILWYYFPTWPAYLMSLCTAGLAAGGTITLNTHLRLLRGFLILVMLPGVVIFAFMRETGSYTFATVLLIYFLFLMGFSRQLNVRYWNALRNSRQLQVALHKAEEASRVKSLFLANVSHEIRTPLNAVMGLAQMGKRDSHDIEVRDRFRHILNSSQHLLNIVNEILDLSTLEAGKLQVESKAFVLDTILNDAFSIAKASAQAKNLSIAVERDPDVPNWVMGDSQRLRQVLVNLLDNAVKFTEEGKVRLIVHRHDAAICFSVIDTGIGMDGSQISHIFKPFEQVDGTATREFGGAGLGLAISRNLARLMGGDITVESALNQGSTFTLCLPIAETEQPDNYRPREIQPAGTRLAGLKVMAVEDDELNRKVLCEMLEYEGAVVTLAESGPEALECLEKAGPTGYSIVLMDVQMPMMDGYEVTRHIHLAAPGLPVVGLTAHAMDDERERCIAAGMVAHITKPINVDDLVAVLQEKSLGIKSLDNSGPPETASTGPPDGSRHFPLPGIDVDVAMKNLNCDWPAFENILSTFYDSRKDSKEEIASLIDRGAIDEAREIVHGIRGASGYVGAWELCQEAASMEDACKTGNIDVVKEQMQSFVQRLDEVIRGLEGLCGSESLN
jgi:signal transduction histidine kinase/CheY-like chemotaxis protein/HPt (histidine-containing phosphotransfer) domain-containing protein